MTTLRVDGDGSGNVKTEYPPEDPNSPQAGRRATVQAAANVNDVMLEQLEYLIEHARGGICGCEGCSRYERARKILMEPFAEPERTAKAGA